MEYNDYEGFCKLLNDDIERYRAKMQQLSGKEIYDRHCEIRIYEAIYDYMINSYTNYNIKFIHKENILDFLYNKFQRTLYGLDDNDLNDFIQDVIKEERQEIKDNFNDKYLIKGKLYNPILFGDELEDWGGRDEDSTCGDCGCKSGEQHLPNCDIERCPCCGLQMLSCDCGAIYVVSPNDMDRLPEMIEEQKKENIRLEEEYKRIMEEYEKKEALKKKKSDQEM